METLLINEKFICQFKFWMDDRVQQGMRFRNDLFAQVAGFQSSQRREAFELAWKLSQERGQQVVVTATHLHYTVWLNLRSPASSTPWVDSEAQSPVLVAC